MVEFSSKKLIKSLDPQTDREELLLLLKEVSSDLSSDINKAIYLSLASQKKLEKKLFTEANPIVDKIFKIKYKNNPEAILLISRHIPENLQLSLFSSFSNNEKITNHFLKKNILFLDFYIKQLFGSNIFSESEKGFIMRDSNPQKHLLFKLLNSEDPLKVLEQNKLPSWFLSSFIDKMDLNKTLPNELILSLVSSNKNLSKEKASSVFKKHPSFKYGEAQKLDHKTIIDFVKSTKDFLILKNKKMDAKTFNSLFELMSEDLEKQQSLIKLFLYNKHCPSEIVRACLIKFPITQKTQEEISFDLLVKKTKIYHFKYKNIYLLSLLKFIKKEALLLLDEECPTRFLKEKFILLKNKKSELTINNESKNYNEISKIENQISDIHKRLIESSNKKNTLTAIFN